jgi:hypothetical protein
MSEMIETTMAVKKLGVPDLTAPEAFGPTFSTAWVLLSRCTQTTPPACPSERGSAAPIIAPDVVWQITCV